MSYESLVGDVIDAQRTLLGDGATDVARQVEGLVLTEDGDVDQILDDGADVVADLAAAYEDSLGLAAASTTQSVAEEYSEDLELPRNLQ